MAPSRMPPQPSPTSPSPAPGPCTTLWPVSALLAFGWLRGSLIVALGVGGGGGGVSAVHNVACERPVRQPLLAFGWLGGSPLWPWGLWGWGGPQLRM